MNDTSTPMFSRSLLGGKKTCKIEARVSDEVKEAIRRRWVDLGYGSESEYIETLATVDCYGVDHVRMIQDRRLSMVCSVSAIAPTAG
jgi:hypothetical protein